MKKYLVEIYLPTVDKKFDTYLPAKKRISEIVELLLKMTASLTDGKYKGTSNSLLLYASGGEPIDKNKTVDEAGIKNSSKLVLI